MRLFIAALLPEAVLDALAETSSLLRSSVRGRFVAPDSYHVTLAFLGDVSEHLVDDCADAIGRASFEAAPFDVTLGDYGHFGKRHKATLWQGFREAGSLPELAQSTRAELLHKDIAFDEKSFLPHVTLMRATNLSAGELPAPVIASGCVSEIALFQSDLSGKRPVYRLLHVAEL